MAMLETGAADSIDANGEGGSPPAHPPNAPILIGTWQLGGTAGDVRGTPGQVPGGPAVTGFEGESVAHDAP